MVTGQCKGDGAFEYYYIRRKEENSIMVLRWRRHIVVRRPLEEVKEEVKHKTKSFGCAVEKLPIFLSHLLPKFLEKIPPHFYFTNTQVHSFFDEL